jgi:hypothetical protein
MPGKSFSFFHVEVATLLSKNAIYCPLCDVAKSRETLRTIGFAYYPDWIKHTQIVAGVVEIYHCANRNATLFIYRLFYM